MAFNLQKVLRALLFASNGPLTIKQIQETLTRFHAQEADLLAALKSEAAPAVAGSPEAPADGGSAPTEGAAEVPASEVAVIHGESIAVSDAPVSADSAAAGSGAPADATADLPLGLSAAETDPELYAEVPSLITTAQIRESMDVIANELRARDEVFFLIEGSSGFRLVTNPKTARWVRLLRDEPPPVRLSQAALETLAVIAYRQPVTRGEIESIRGVSAEAGVNKLLERGLIYVAGRAELPGRPIQFGTTDEFLEFVGIKSLAEMPASDVLSNRQIDDWLKKTENPVHLGDKDVGLETSELPLETMEEPVEAAVATTHEAPAPGDASTSPNERASQSEPPAAAS